MTGSGSTNPLRYGGVVQSAKKFADLSQPFTRSLQSYNRINFPRYGRGGGVGRGLGVGLGRGVALGVSVGVAVGVAVAVAVAVGVGV